METQWVVFYNLEAKVEISSIEEKVSEEKMGDNDGPVEEFTENEADEIVGVPVA